MSVVRDQVLTSFPRKYSAIWAELIKHSPEICGAGFPACLFRNGRLESLSHTNSSPQITECSAGMTIPDLHGYKMRPKGK
jgi:hypothetical protein